ncbi:MAG: Double zinc ribbon [Methanomassiliicoccales archaeon PtaB.Bin215]|nr:MAG: Double zinc ribbon [Methanomassiliicoccales archaeon PtaB.Bin215]
MSLIGDINEMMKGIRQSKMSIWVGMGLALLVTVSLTLTVQLWLAQVVCLLPILVALLAYYIPTYFGLKDRKRLAVFGLVLFLVIGLSLGSALYSTVSNYEVQDVSSDDNLLVAGTVSPSHVEPGDLLQFSVVLTSGNNSSDVHLLLFNNWGDPEDDLNLSMGYSHDSTLGAVYTLNTSSLDEGIYYFQYGVLEGTAWTETPQSFGPVNADLNKVLSNSLMSGTVYSFYSMAVLFYILILLTWWMDRSKKKIFEMEQKRAQTKDKKVKDAKDEKFVCSDCGAEVPGEADKCPSCGAKFDDDELKCPQCSAKLLKSDTKCWNCGKKL